MSTNYGENQNGLQEGSSYETQGGGFNNHDDDGRESGASIARGAALSVTQGDDRSASSDSGAKHPKSPRKFWNISLEKLFTRKGKKDPKPDQLNLTVPISLKMSYDETLNSTQLDEEYKKHTEVLEASRKASVETWIQLAHTRKKKLEEAEEEILMYHHVIEDLQEDLATLVEKDQEIRKLREEKKAVERDLMKRLEQADEKMKKSEQERKQLTKELQEQRHVEQNLRSQLQEKVSLTCEHQGMNMGDRAQPPTKSGRANSTAWLTEGVIENPPMVAPTLQEMKPSDSMNLLMCMAETMRNMQTGGDNDDEIEMPPPQPFHGKDGDSSEHWIKYMRLYTRGMGIEQTAMVMRRYLKGAASKAIGAIPKEDRDNPEMVYQALLARWSDKTALRQSREQFFDLVWSETETLEDLLDQLISRRINGWGRGWDDQEARQCIMDRFIDAVKKPLIREEIHRILTLKPLEELHYTAMRKILVSIKKYTHYSVRTKMAQQSGYPRSLSTDYSDEASSGASTDDADQEDGQQPEEEICHVRSRGRDPGQRDKGQATCNIYRKPGHLIAHCPDNPDANFTTKMAGNMQEEMNKKLDEIFKKIAELAKKDQSKNE